MCKRLFLWLCLLGPAWGHEAYFVRWTGYQADESRLRSCSWLKNSTQGRTAFYFSDRTGRQFVLCYPSQPGQPGRLRLLGRPVRTLPVHVKVWVDDGRHLSLEFTGKGISGELWLDLLGD